MQILRRKRLRRTRNLFLLGLVAVLMIISAFPSAPGSSNVIELSMLYGSEKRGWIERVTPIFQEQWKTLHPNTTLQINFVALGTGESMNQIILGEAKPVIWSPASSVWIPLANSEWSDEYGQSNILVDNWRSLVGSPVIIATWEAYAHKNNLNSWESIYRIASSPSSDLKFAHTDPQLSNSGFMSILMEVAAALNMTTQQMTYEDLLRPQANAWLKEVEGRSVAYGDSTGFLADQATTSGPSGINVFVVYENLVIQKNLEGEPKARWNQTLLAVYPSEGVLVSDHPFCILNAPWVTKDQRLAAQEFFNFLMSPEIQVLAMRYGFRPVNPQVALDPSIFRSENGVSPLISCPILQAPADARVQRRVTDLWLISRPGG